ncbi:NAD(P)H-binding protein [Roseateles sp. LKC17W]|uniref:NAD(P)H-binding protein n=1 Tax=Pelomonas margarita TaxID=3299031 RepID=A0ABW7FI92_9BURK
MLAITGASGALGQRVLQHLVHTLGHPAGQILALTRQPATLAAWAEQGVQVRAFDLDAPDTLPAALQGASRLLLISTDAVGRRLVQHQAAIDAAHTAGLQHVVYTSMPRPEASPLLLAPEHLGTEHALAAAGLAGWTVLRNHWYFENLFGSLPQALASGQWYTADEGQPSADIARDDLALAAATALADGFTGQRTLTLSGPEALTKVDMARRISAATGRGLSVVQVPLAAIVNGLQGAGLPAPLAEVYASFDTNTGAGRVADITGDFEALTGRKPRSFDDWLVHNADTLQAL